MQIDLLRTWQVPADVFLERRDEAVCFLERDRRRDLDMKVDRHLPRPLVHGKIVDREAASRGEAAHRARGVRPGRHGLHVDDDVASWIEAADTLFDAVRDLMPRLDRERPVDDDDDVHELIGARPPHSYAAALDDPGRLLSRARDRLAVSFGRAVGEHVHRFPSEPDAQGDDDRRDAERGQGIGLLEPRTETEAAAGANEGETEDHDSDAQHVGREVQGVGLERLASVLLRGAPESPGAREIDHDRNRKHGEGERRHFDVDLVKEDPLHGLAEDPDAGQEQEQCLAERGKILESLVSIIVLFVRGPA